MQADATITQTRACHAASAVQKRRCVRPEGVDQQHKAARAKIVLAPLEPFQRGAMHADRFGHESGREPGTRSQLADTSAQTDKFRFTRALDVNQLAKSREPEWWAKRDSTPPSTPLRSVQGAPPPEGVLVPHTNVMMRPTKERSGASSQWAKRDSNPRPSGCKPDALTN